MARGSIFKACAQHGTTGTQGKPACRARHGSWGYVIPVGPDPVTGRPKQRRRRGFADRDSAEQEMRRELARIDAGQWVDDKGVTLAAWLAEWLELKAQGGIQPTTLRGYRAAATEWARVLPHITLRDLRRAHIDQALLDLRDQPARAGLSGRRITSGIRSAGTLDQYRRVLRAALTEARLRGLITANPAEGRMTAIGVRQQSPPQMWEPEEMVGYVRAAAALDDPTLGAGLVIAAFSGLRRGEVMGARWPSLDPSWRDLQDTRPGMTVAWTLVEIGRRAIPDHLIGCAACGVQHAGMLWRPHPKSSASRRWVPLVAPARSALLTLERLQAERRAALGADWSEHDLMCAGPDGTPMSPSLLSDAHARLLAELGLRSMSLHALRHSACSLMLAGGVPLDIVQMILGHASPEVTRRVYAHLQRGVVGRQVEDAFGALGML